MNLALQFLRRLGHSSYRRRGSFRPHPRFRIGSSLLGRGHLRLMRLLQSHRLRSLLIKGEKVEIIRHFLRAPCLLHGLGRSFLRGSSRSRLLGGHHFGRPLRLPQLPRRLGPHLNIRRIRADHQRQNRDYSLERLQ